MTSKFFLPLRNETEVQALRNLLDLGVKSGGIAVAGNALALLQNIQETPTQVSDVPGRSTDPTKA